MPATGRKSHSAAALLIGCAFAGVLITAIGAVLIVLVVSVLTAGGCDGSRAGATSIALGPPGSGQLVGASEYGGPGDPSSGVMGARGDNLQQHPDSYAELGGLTWDTATAMGGLPYMTPLRVTWGPHSAMGYKRDFGLGGGPINGLPRVIDLWWQFAGGLGIPYEDGMWSGPVRVERPPATGAAGVLGQAGAQSSMLVPAAAGPADPSACAPGAIGGVALTPGDRARLLSNGLAAAPENAPIAIKEMIAAGNQIVGKPYVYGGAHGLPLSEVAPAYDCSSSVEHVLYGARLLPVTYGGSSSELESFGDPGTGQWVTLYANASHVFMYVAGLRWDTHNAAGPGDGSSGIGWHPLVRDASGFVARHPAGL